MAFEFLNDYTDSLLREWNMYKKFHDDASAAYNKCTAEEEDNHRRTVRRYIAKMDTVDSCLISYMTTVLARPRFRSQRAHAFKALETMNKQLANMLFNPDGTKRRIRIQETSLVN